MEFIILLKKNGGFLSVMEFIILPKHNSIHQGGIL